MRDAAESHLRKGEGLRGRILDAAKMRREVGGPFLERVGRLYKIEGDAALKPGARRLGRLPTDT